MQILFKSRLGLSGLLLLSSMIGFGCSNAPNSGQTVANSPSNSLSNDPQGSNPASPEAPNVAQNPGTTPTLIRRVSLTVINTRPANPTPETSAEAKASEAPAVPPVAAPAPAEVKAPEPVRVVFVKVPVPVQGPAIEVVRDRIVKQVVNHHHIRVIRSEVRISHREYLKKTFGLEFTRQKSKTYNRYQLSSLIDIDQFNAWKESQPENERHPSVRNSIYPAIKAYLESTEEEQNSRRRNRVQDFIQALDNHYNDHAGVHSRNSNDHSELSLTEFFEALEKRASLHKVQICDLLSLDPVQATAEDISRTYSSWHQQQPRGLRFWGRSSEYKHFKRVRDAESEYRRLEKEAGIARREAQVEARAEEKAEAPEDPTSNPRQPVVLVLRYRH